MTAQKSKFKSRDKNIMSYSDLSDPRNNYFPIGTLWNGLAPKALKILWIDNLKLTLKYTSSVTYIMLRISNSSFRSVTMEITYAYADGMSNH